MKYVVFTPSASKRDPLPQGVGECAIVLGTFEEAVARTLALTSNDQPAMLWFNPQHLVTPTSIGGSEWAAACLAYLDTNGIQYAQYTSADKPKVDQLKEARDVISGYVRASKLLSERVKIHLIAERQLGRARVSGYICGRPPYGYSVSHGRFVINEQQAAAVNYVFTCIRAGDSCYALAAKLRDKYPDGGVVHGRAQYWDRVKVRRVLSHARLYCLGEYCGGRLTNTVTLPELAFLPPEWADTTTSITTKE